jgi:hypothetical protein
MSTGVPSARKRHVFLGHDLGDHALVAVAAGHFVADRELALRGDVNLDRLDDAAVGAFARFGALDFLVVLHLQVVELLFEAADDLVDLVANRRGINLDPVIHFRQLAQQGLGDLAIGRNDDFARLAVDHVERNFFAQQNVAQTPRSTARAIRRSSCDVPPRSVWLALASAGGGFLAVRILLGGDFDIHDDAVSAGRHLERGVLHVRGLLTEDGAEQGVLRARVRFRSSA